MPDASAASAWLEWLEGSGVAVAVRQTPWLYPAVEIVHIVGIVLLAGGAAMFDLRLLGLTRAMSVADAARHLLRLSRAGLAVAAVSGALLFAAEATSLVSNPAFRTKLVLIILAGANAGLFHAATFKSVEAWDREGRTPLAARAAAILSLVLWAGVIACGRLIAYV
jgi:hypothetical protein